MGKGQRGGLPRTLCWRLISQTRHLATASCKGVGCQALSISASPAEQKRGVGAVREDRWGPLSMWITV